MKKYVVLLLVIGAISSLAAFNYSDFIKDNANDIVNPYCMEQQSFLDEATPGIAVQYFRTARFFHQSCDCTGPYVICGEQDIIMLADMWRVGSYIWNAGNQCHVFLPECYEW